MAGMRRHVPLNLNSMRYAVRLRCVVIVRCLKTGCAMWGRLHQFPAMARGLGRVRGHWAARQFAVLAPLAEDGVCGGVNGSMVEKAPEKELCAVGTSTRVTGNGPWSWNCAGVHGGNTVSCTALSKTAGTAPQSADGAVKVACGAAAETFTKPTESLCVGGKATPVEGEGPWTWSCESGSGQSISCSTLEGVDGVCGAASGVKALEKPDRDLCLSGLPTEVEPYDNTTWRWSWQGGVNAKSIDCAAPMAVSPTAYNHARKMRTAWDLPISPTPICARLARLHLLKAVGRGAGAAPKARLRFHARLCVLLRGLAVPPTDRFSAKPPLPACAIPACRPMSRARVRGCGAASVLAMAEAPAARRLHRLIRKLMACVAAHRWIDNRQAIGQFVRQRNAQHCLWRRPMDVDLFGDEWRLGRDLFRQSCGAKGATTSGPKVNGVCGYSNGVASVVAPEDGLCSTAWQRP